MSLDQVTKVELRLLRDEQWLLIDTPDTSPRAMLDAYLDGAHLSCSAMQGGLFIDVDGEPWSDDGTVDEFRMTRIWFDAMHALVRGADSFGPGFGPWEQSRLAWTRDGDLVTMVDGGASTMMWSVTVDLPSLALDVADRGRAFATWTREIRRLNRDALANPRTAERAAIIDTNLLADRDLALVDELVDWIRPP